MPRDHACQHPTGTSCVLMQHQPSQTARNAAPTTNEPAMRLNARNPSRRTIWEPSGPDDQAQFALILRERHENKTSNRSTTATPSRRELVARGGKSARGARRREDGDRYKRSPPRPPATEAPKASHPHDQIVRDGLSRQIRDQQNPRAAHARCPPKQPRHVVLGTQARPQQHQRRLPPINANTASFGPQVVTARET